MDDKEWIYVTQPVLPPLEEFKQYLEQIWDSRWLTNNGPLHENFEKELAAHLGVPYVSLFSNGTLALITALQALRITGEVITTPFSFVATTHALYWNGIKPVFCDIEDESCNIDPERIESAITPKTTAILAVHVYGNPCNVEKIKRIADIYGLHVIYDAAHAFDVKINGNSVLNFGDLSVLSFHATKVFNTFEGGAIISHDEKTKKRIDYLKNFGFANELTVVAPGINAKMNEFQAAVGLLQLKYVGNYIEERRKVFAAYAERLSSVAGIRLPAAMEGVSHNYSYYPVFINARAYGHTRDEVYDRLKDAKIYGRRYFYPLISSFPFYKDLPSAGVESLPVANRAASEVLCLPVYPGLKEDDIERICNVIRTA